MAEAYTPLTSYAGYNTSTTGGLINQYQAAASTAYAANLQREKQAADIYDKIIAMYGEGGAYGKGYLAQLEKQKVQDVGSMSQKAISSGLYGLRDLGAEWESTTGETGRLKLEDIKMERLSSALAAKAGFLTSISDTYPDYSSLQNALQATASAPSGGISSGGLSDAQKYGFVSGKMFGQPGSWTTPSTATPTTTTTPTGGKTEPITMGQGYGPAFQTQEEMTKIAGGAGATATGTTAGKQVPKYLTDYYGKEITGEGAAYPTWLVQTGRMPATTNLASWTPLHIHEAVVAEKEWAKIKAQKTSSTSTGTSTTGGGLGYEG